MDEITVKKETKYYRPLRELVLIMLEQRTTIVVPQSVSKTGLAEGATMYVFDAGVEALKILNENGIKLGDQVMCNPDQSIKITMEGKDFLQLNVYDIIAYYSTTKPPLYDKFFGPGPIRKDL